VFSVTFDRLYQVRDKVVTPFQLNVYLSPGVLNLVTKAYQAVIGAHDDSQKDNYDTKDNPDRNHI
jgi:hypothetical protein